MPFHFGVKSLGPSPSAVHLKSDYDSAGVLLPAAGANVSQPNVALSDPGRVGAVDQLSINTIRTLAIDAVHQANSAHPAPPLPLAPPPSDLCHKFLRSH